MKRDEAHRCLSKYLALVEQARKQPMWSKERKATTKAVKACLPEVNEILRELLPDSRVITAWSVNDHVWALPEIYRALHLLAGWEDITAREQNDADPVLPIKWLDPVISTVAIPLWRAEKYRQAVNDAATSLSRFAQERLGRHDINDKELMVEAFGSAEPTEGKPRLRCPGDHTDPAVRSMQTGALSLAQGCYLAIRNPAHHMTGDWNPVTGAEHLGALSMVARWVRHWDIKRYIPPTPEPKEINALLERYYKEQRQTRKALAQPTD